MALALAMFAAGCKKKVPAPAPPPSAAAGASKPAPPPPAAPTVAQFTAEPTSIQRGQSSTLRWEVTGNVTSVSINQGVGTVQSTGNSRVIPSDSTTYTPDRHRSGRLRHRDRPRSACPLRRLRRRHRHRQRRPATIDQALASDVQDAYFDYDKTDIRSDARDVLTGMPRRSRRSSRTSRMRPS